LSQQIRQLEEELGVRLFQRTKREVRLTEAGKRIVNEAQQVLGRIDHFCKVAAQAGEGEIGHLSVGVTGGINEILVETLRRLGSQFPGVHIELQYMSTGTQIEALREGRIDLGFVNMPVLEPSLAVEKVRSEPMWVALPKGHPLARQHRVALTALEHQPMIFFPRRVTPGLHDSITALCKNKGFTLNVAHEVDSLVGSLTLVSAELGIAFCTPEVQRLWPHIAFRPLRDPVTIEQGVCYRRDAQSPVLQTFLRVVRQVTQRHAERAKTRSVS
jgi:DNA-binding transcriptional LysR family regulator